MPVRHTLRFLIPAMALACAFGFAGCGEDCATCPACPETGYRTFVLRPDGTGDRPTIQEAIDDADRGDVILLEDGIYRGPGNRNLAVGGKGLAIVSRSGNPAACYIDCGDTDEGGFRALQMVDNREGLWMDGIGFRNARSPIGGAIYCRGSALRLINCAFVDNDAETGGGLAAVDSDVLLEGCIFEANAADTGGAIWAQRGEIRIHGCSFSSNEAGAGGGGVRASGTDLAIRNSTFSGNSVSGSGAGIHSSGGSLRAAGLRCSGNTAGQYGGAVYIEDARGAVINDSEIADNQARAGSAVYSDGSLVMNGCTISGNLADDHGAIRLAGGVLLAGSCTIADNAGPSHGAALILSGDSQAVLERCILAYNQNGLAVRCFGDAQVRLSCCDVYGHPQGDYEGCLAGQEGQRGNISADPRFCSDTDYRISGDSPCATAPCGFIGSREVGCR